MKGAIVYFITGTLVARCNISLGHLIKHRGVNDSQLGFPNHITESQVGFIARIHSSASKDYE